MVQESGWNISKRRLSSICLECFPLWSTQVSKHHLLLLPWGPRNPHYLRRYPVQKVIIITILEIKTTVCFSVSFSGIGKWLGNIEEFGLPGVPLILLGNKADLESKREVGNVISTMVIRLVQVERERGEALAREHSMAFLETSARTGANVAQASSPHHPSKYPSTVLNQLALIVHIHRPSTAWLRPSWRAD